jgi:hypothetical protein
MALEADGNGIVEGSRSGREEKILVEEGTVFFSLARA